MSLADKVKAGMEQLSQAQAKIIDSYGGNPPPELTEQIQKLQERMAGTIESVQTLSDQSEEAKAKAESLKQATVYGRPEDKENGVDFEAYPWKFHSKHGLAPDEMSRLVRSLMQASDRSA